MAGNVSERMNEHDHRMWDNRTNKDNDIFQGSEIWGEIKRQGEKKKQPSHIREQTQSQRGFQMSDRFDKLQVAFKLFTSSRTQRLTGQAVTESERN